MKSLKVMRTFFTVAVVFMIILSLLSSWGSTKTFAQENGATIQEIRAIYESETGISQPIGLVFSSWRNVF